VGCQLAWRNLEGGPSFRQLSGSRGGSSSSSGRHVRGRARGGATVGMGCIAGVESITCCSKGPEFKHSLQQLPLRGKLPSSALRSASGGSGRCHWGGACPAAGDGRQPPTGVRQGQGEGGEVCLETGGEGAGDGAGGMLRRLGGTPERREGPQEAQGEGPSAEGRGRAGGGPIGPGSSGGGEGGERGRAFHAARDAPHLPLPLPLPL